jgi:hypothetical protein
MILLPDVLAPADSAKHGLLLFRCWQPCVCKWFKTGAVYEETFFEKDLKAVKKAQEFIDAFNSLGITASRISLNHPRVWVFERSAGRYAGQNTLTEPFINNYRKFNSNTGHVGGHDGWSEVGFTSKAVSQVKAVS